MRVLMLVSCGLLLAANASAEPSTKVSWTPETLRFVKNGNAEHGKDLAQSCGSCHNLANPAPHLDGQLATYLYRQLQDFKSSTRENMVMQALAANLSDQDMADLAAHYAALSPVPGSGSADDPTGIAHNGDGTRMEPPCAVCHNGNGEGEKVDTPRLAGQKTEYLEMTLLAYKSGIRANDVYHRMRLIASKLSELEIKQLALYYSKLH